MGKKANVALQCTCSSKKNVNGIVVGSRCKCLKYSNIPGKESKLNLVRVSINTRRKR